MSFNLSRLFADLEKPSDPMLGVGRGSVGSIRSFSLPFIPEEVAAAEESEETTEALGDVLYQETEEGEGAETSAPAKTTAEKVAG